MFEKIYYLCFGPSIYGKFTDDNYEMTTIEYLGSNLVKFFKGIRCCATTLFPITFYWYYKQTHGFTNITSIVNHFCIILLFYGLRTLGRAFNGEYWKMINLLLDHYKNPEDVKILHKLLVYDIDISSLHGIDPKANTNLWIPDSPMPAERFSPRAILAYICVNTFGLRMVYPGSVSLLYALCEGHFHGCRREMFRSRNIERVERYPVATVDGNIIDVVLLADRRNKGECVIVCDGNAGLYEGFMSKSFAEAGYDVIIWNPPGFGQSTGVPYPLQVMNAVNAVYALAKNVLNYDPLVYGWSIGGFPASWLAANYKIRTLFIDASFDSLLPLAKAVMPDSMENVVEYAVGRYFNMPVSEQLSRHKGNVVIFRRRFDEMIVTDRSSLEASLLSNRGNFLLRDFLHSRYSFINWTGTDDLTFFKYLHATEEQRKSRDEFQFSDSMPESVEEFRNFSPQKRAKFICALTSYHFRDLDLGHNVPLPVDATFQPVTVKIPFAFQDDMEENHES
uniref:AB hydrolase-1 domain-containing protein n=1 Tax=Panagrolaimus sp. ES5 TaxID=591445 RepID=A0AC34FW45_9BILA